MGEYFAMRISGGYLDYNVVISKYPQFKEDIDRILEQDYNMSFK